jgi:hypothetical protein
LGLGDFEKEKSGKKSGSHHLWRALRLGHKRFLRVPLRRQSEDIAGVRKLPAMQAVSRKIEHGATVPVTETVGDVSGLVTKLVVARVASVSPRCVDNWIAQKKIPAIKISPRCIRFSLPAVMRALEKFEIREVTR